VSIEDVDVLTGRDMTDTPQTHDETIDRAARIIAESLARGLKEAEVIIAAEREARAQALQPQLVDTLDRFGEVLTKLVEYNGQLSERITELTEAVTRMATAHERAAAPAAVPHPQLPELEPAFAPGGEGIDVTIAAVPGFQGLMEVQRTLVRLPGVQSAAVRRYQDDEAAIQLVLSQPMSASVIAEGVATGTGRKIFVDESRPDALRLRLRFLHE
jgi:hypothetical protein